MSLEGTGGDHDTDRDPDQIDSEVDFSSGRRGEFRDWYQKAKGRFVHVSDEEDRARQANNRPRPGANA